MIIGDVKAARKLPDGLASYCVKTCLLRSLLHDLASTVLGPIVNAEPRSSDGSVIDGSDLKNSTPPVKLLIDSPVIGSSRMPVGSAADTSTSSGPSCDRPTWIVNPPVPPMTKPPSSPP